MKIINAVCHRVDSRSVFGCDVTVSLINERAAQSIAWYRLRKIPPVNRQLELESFSAKNHEETYKGGTEASFYLFAYLRGIFLYMLISSIA